MGVVKSLSGSLTIISAGGSLKVEPGGGMTKGNLEGSERVAGTVAVVTISVPT